MKKLLFSVSPLSTPASLSTLVLRLVFGLFMLAGHGWRKLIGFSDIAEGFMDFMGLGSTVSLGLAVFAEVVCAALVALGLFTRAALIPLIITMGVAAFIRHGPDPLFMGSGPSKEPALLFMGAFLAIFLAGPGKFSLDAMIRK